jgi:HK97 family phage major capsid protein
VNVKELHEKFQTALKAARDICDAVDQANRDFTAEERTQVQKHLEEARGLKAKIKEAEGDEALRKTVDELGEGIGLASKKGQLPTVPAALKGTLGERFVESEQFKAWLKHAAPGGQIPDQAKGLMSPPVEFKTLLTGDSDTSGGAFVVTDHTGIYEPLGRRPLALRDLIAIRSTTSDLVEFVRQTAKVTQAAPTAEANVTEYSGATGQVSGQKPEGAMTFEKVTTPVKTIAVWIPVTKRALSDAAQLRGIIDQELRDDLEEDLEDEIVGGDGTGEHFTGIENTSGVLSQAWDTDMLTTIRRARTTLAVTGRARPTAILAHPNDAEALDLLKDSQGRFYFGGPAEGGVQRVWRVPVVECEAVTEGQAIMGDFRKAVLWDRERATIQVSDSHSDFFIRNMVAILAEMRAAFGLIRPSAFIKVDLLATS